MTVLIIKYQNKFTGCSLSLHFNACKIVFIFLTVRISLNFPTFFFFLLFFSSFPSRESFTKGRKRTKTYEFKKNKKIYDVVCYDVHRALSSIVSCRPKVHKGALTVFYFPFFPFVSFSFLPRC